MQNKYSKKQVDGLYIQLGTDEILFNAGTIIGISENPYKSCYQLEFMASYTDDARVNADITIACNALKHREKAESVKSLIWRTGGNMFKAYDNAIIIDVERNVIWIAGFDNAYFKNIFLSSFKKEQMKGNLYPPMLQSSKLKTIYDGLNDGTVAVICNNIKDLEKLSNNLSTIIKGVSIEGVNKGDIALQAPLSLSGAHWKRCQSWDRVYMCDKLNDHIEGLIKGIPIGLDSLGIIDYGMEIPE